MVLPRPSSAGAAEAAPEREPEIAAGGSREPQAAAAAAAAMGEEEEGNEASFGSLAWDFSDGGEGLAAAATEAAREAPGADQQEAEGRAGSGGHALHSSMQLCTQAVVGAW